jgi:hypothetical protein
MAGTWMRSSVLAVIALLFISFTLLLGRANAEVSSAPAKDLPNSLLIPAQAPNATSRSRPALWYPGQWLFRDDLSSGVSDNPFLFGLGTSIPLVCDWDGDGTKTPGTFDSGVWRLRNLNSTGNSQLTFNYGSASDKPVCGDWNGDGRDTVGVVRNGEWLLRNFNSSGNVDLAFWYGQPSDTPIVGDWNGDGTDTIGVTRAGVWHLRNSNSTGFADLSFYYGIDSDVPIVGDWDGDYTDTIGIYRNGGWFLRNSNTTGIADLSFSYGTSDNKPLSWSTRNLMRNPIFESQMSGWARWSDGSDGIAAAESCCYNHTPGTRTPGGPNPASSQNVLRVWNGFIIPRGNKIALYQTITGVVTPGETYRLRAWVAHNGLIARVQIWSINFSGVAQVYVCGTTTLSETYYTQIGCEFTVPYGTTNINVQLYSEDPNATYGSGRWAVTDDWTLTKYPHFDRAMAVEYADMWAHARNELYPDFGQNNCTNYISQICEAGSYPQKRAFPLDRLNNTQWWHKKTAPTVYDWSNTWSVAHWFNEFASYYQMFGAEFQIRGTYLDAVDQLEPGDFFLMRLLNPPPPNPGPTHARVILGYGNPQEGIDWDDGCPNSYDAVCLLASQHTTDRYRVPAKYLLSNSDNLEAVWAWHINW